MIWLEDRYYVYMLTNGSRTVLYTGVTNNLGERVLEHYSQRGNGKSFTGRYNCHILVYYEGFENINAAIEREKQIKKWSRRKKEELILAMNPHVVNLYLEVYGRWPPI